MRNPNFRFVGQWARQFGGNAGAGGGPASFVGGGSGVNAAGGTFTISAAMLAGIGAAVGDLITFDVNSSSVGVQLEPAGWYNYGAWNFPGGGGSIWACWRLLSAADISGGLVLSGMAASANVLNTGWGVYRGPNSARVGSLSTNVTAVGTTIPIPGFTPSRYTVGLLALVTNRNLSPGRTAPVGWALRVVNQTNANNFSGGRADLMAPSSYLAGSTVTFTGEGDAVHFKGGMILELIRI